ncbi:hypothetical protein CFO_g2489 [Ceratocystis platani]|uniref:Up-regulated during septation protein 1 domain-containing protein n=1 Tax=Ceratocystis fimbriata f. sp. platani TaxID=88771 RepID=A0A0F8BRG7_CERFI|nr:hypothetical protein CFO_g2489 [Ceratocystis platani]
MASIAVPSPATDASRKYQLFPKAQSCFSKTQAADSGLSQPATLRLRKDPATASSPASSLGSVSGSTRRRKVNVPEIEPMTTVQEAAMDSPTVPGLRPTVERSASGPSSSWRAHIVDFVNPAASSTSSPSKDSSLAGAASIKRSDSPSKNLAPLMIPKNSARSAASVSSRFRNGSSLDSCTSASASSSLSSSASSAYASNYTYRPEGSPAGRRSPQTVHQNQESRPSPYQWERATTPPAGSPPSVPSKSPITSALHHIQNSLHSRDLSDSSASSRIMDRGRPRKRSPSSSTTSTATSTFTSASVSTIASSVNSAVYPQTFYHADIPSPKRSPSSERRAFESLPTGMTLSSATATLSGPELLSLRAQAHEQACRFKILRASDVDELSRELRVLDERIEMLGAEYFNMRGTRRNLHGRVMTLLRARPRVSLDAISRQEEALCELDARIDEMTAQMATVENRRTRVRQKLLEHVAAAAMIPVMQPTAPPKSLAPSTSHHYASTLSTPPRSPVKPSLAPLNTQTSEREISRSVSASALRSAAAESAAASLQSQTQFQAPPRSSSIRRPTINFPAPPSASGPITVRGKTESIYIYAGSDVFGLVSVTEGENAIPPPPPPASEKTAKLATAAHKLRDTERRQVQRSRSHEVLSSGSFEAPRKSPTPPTPTSRSAKMLQTPSSQLASSAASVRSFSDLPLLPSVAFVPGSTSTSASSTPVPSHDEGASSDSEVMFLTSAVFSG